MATYNETAIAAAQARGLTADDVQRMGYTQIADLAGVTLGPNGESPADFFYAQVRNATVTYLRDHALEILRKEEEEELAAFLRLNPKLRGRQVYRDEEGNLVVK